MHARDGAMFCVASQISCEIGRGWPGQGSADNGKDTRIGDPLLPVWEDPSLTPINSQAWYVLFTYDSA